LEDIMSAVNSTMLPLGTKAPAFRLPDTQGRMVSLDDCREARAVLVMFLSNHCPYVKHIRSRVAALGKDLQQRGVAVVAINANDITRYPEDSPPRMAQEVREVGYTFPYLYDESQDVAKAYRAACTPDFFLFDEERRLTYRGQMDDSRPGNDKPNTGADLLAAVEATLAGRPIPEEQQKPSLGCSIKWRPGNEPDYY
jgi:peroxiredoxin